MDRIAIVVRDDAYDKVLTPLAFAFTAAASNMEVDMLFVNWAVRLLSEKGEPGPSSRPEADAWLRAQVSKAGLPPRVRDILKALKGTGRVRFYACSLASQIFEVEKEDLIAEAEGIVGAGWFLEEKANGAHTQYF